MAKVVQECRTVRPPLRILELYSGIGGMHVAARESGLPFNIVGSYEINPTALEVYRHNFPKTPKAANIMGLTVEHMTSLAPDVIMMSPPCQPFTRQGLQRDVEDARTSSLLHVLSILKEVPNPPGKILLENVAGFEKSLARECLLEMLTERNYVWQEILISPTQVGIPNSRLRYYLLAQRQPSFLCFRASDKVEEEFPVCLCIAKKIQDQLLEGEETCERCGKVLVESVQCLLKRFHSNMNPALLQASKSYSEILSALSCYLDTDTDFEPYLLKDKILSKYCTILDIVDENSKRSCCFTKGYGHYVEGTGSVIKGDVSSDVDDVYTKVGKLAVDNPERIELLHQLRMRYFTATEIARLMCFPKWFSFPQSLTMKQKYRVLGNSINILVVTSLLLVLCER